MKGEIRYEYKVEVENGDIRISLPHNTSHPVALQACLDFWKEFVGQSNKANELAQKKLDEAKKSVEEKE